MRRNILRLLGLSIAAAAVLLYINSIDDGGDSTASDPARRLQCTAGSHIAAAYATATPSTRETRTPEDLATAWAQVRSKTLLKNMHRVYEEPDRIDIALDAEAHVVAVLTFRASEPLGWHLDAVHACQLGVTQRTQTPEATPSEPAGSTAPVTPLPEFSDTRVTPSPGTPPSSGP